MFPQQHPVSRSERALNITLVRGSAMAAARAQRHRTLHPMPQRRKRIRKIVRVKRRTYGVHAATDVDAACRGNDGTLRRDHTPYRRANAVMDVRHDGDAVRVDDRQPRGIAQLAQRLGLDVVRPQQDRTCPGVFDDVQLVRSRRVS